MNEEEKEAIKTIESFKNMKWYNYAFDRGVEILTEEERREIDIVINLIDKQQKEIEKFKQLNNKMYGVTIPLNKQLIPKYKIKEKIKEIESLPLLDFAEKEKFNFEYSIDGLYCMKKGVIFILKELLGETNVNK